METPTAERASGLSNLNAIIAVVGGLIAVVGGLLAIGATFLSIAGIVIGALYGYFTLQRDTADNKAALTEYRVQTTAANDAFKKQIQDLVESVGKRFTDDEKTVHDINENGTSYGRNKVDTRMNEIADVRARVDKVEIAFAAMAPKVDRIADHMEQVWGDYNSRNFPAAQRIDPKILPK